MRYHLKIEDCGEESETLLSIAEGEYGGGTLKLNYVYDGADYSLLIGGNFVVHNRYGDTRMKLEFREGQRTVGTIQSGEMRGNLDIFTHELKIILTANGCSAHISFSDGGENSLKIVKNITAYAVK